MKVTESRDQKSAKHRRQTEDRRRERRKVQATESGFTLPTKETLERTKSLLMAALRVWELKNPFFSWKEKD
jgi:hypothetical protein